jgi:hypothetical protein
VDHGEDLGVVSLADEIGEVESVGAEIAEVCLLVLETPLYKLGWENASGGEGAAGDAGGDVELVEALGTVGDVVIVLLHEEGGLAELETGLAGQIVGSQPVGI